MEVDFRLYWCAHKTTTLTSIQQTVYLTSPLISVVLGSYSLPSISFISILNMHHILNVQSEISKRDNAIKIIYLWSCLQKTATYITFL